MLQVVVFHVQIIHSAFYSVFLFVLFCFKQFCFPIYSHVLLFRVCSVLSFSVINSAKFYSHVLFSVFIPTICFFAFFLKHNFPQRIQFTFCFSYFIRQIILTFFLLNSNVLFEFHFYKIFNIKFQLTFRF